MPKRRNAVFHNTNSREVLRAILAIHFPDDLLIADLTWGKGAFWEGQPVIGLDIEPRLGCHIRADARAVPLQAGLIDVAVLDPPHTWSRGKNPGSAGLVSDYGFLPSKDALLTLCCEAAREIRRIATAGAILKIMDTVKHGKYHAVHIEVAKAIEPDLGVLEDIAILDSGVVRPEGPNWKDQKHLRNGQSYFLVYRWA